MSDDTSMPGSLGARAAAPSETSLTDPVLVRLYESLKGLDKAIHDTLRALDVALGREPTTGPPDGLPFRELGRLKNQLEAATGHADSQPRRRSLGDIALEVQDKPADESPRAGVAPTDG